MSNDLATLRQFLGAGQGEFGKAIRGNISPELLVRACLTYCQKNPRVFECSKESIAKCLMDCASLGLLPDGTLGTAYLVPYKTTCTLIIGYRGMIELARRSGELTKIEARVVREGDVFDIEFGTSAKLRHVPDFKGDPDRPIMAVYATATFHNGETQAEVMSIGEVEAIRKRSRAADSGPWVSDFAEMAKKTVVRRICKYLPLTPELASAFEAEDREIIQDADATITDKPKTKAAQLAKQLESKPAAPVQEQLDAVHDAVPEPVSTGLTEEEKEAIRMQEQADAEDEKRRRAALEAPAPREEKKAGKQKTMA